MKVWEIKIEAKDEETALKYLKMVVRSFELAVLVDQPMNFTSGENVEEKSKMVCKLKEQYGKNSQI